MLGPATLFGHNRYEDEDFRDTFLTKTLIMLAMRIFDNDPHVICINILAQNQTTGKDDEDNDCKNRISAIFGSPGVFQNNGCHKRLDCICT